MTSRLIAIMALAAFVIAALIFGPAACNSIRGAKKQAEVSSEQGNASINAGAEAVNTIGNVSANAAATDDALDQGRGEVRAAPEGQKGKATVNAACRFKINRDKPACKGATP